MNPIERFLVLGINRFYKISYEMKKSYSFQGQVSTIHTMTTSIVQPLMRISFIWPFTNLTRNSEEFDDENLLSIADDLYENRDYGGCYEFIIRNREFIKNLDEAEVAWRLTRIMYFMSKEPNINEEDKINFIQRAYNLIYDQLQRNPDNYAVQKWYALLLDAKASQEGIIARLSQLETVKMHMDIAVSINPKDATTLHMLGEWCFQLSDMPWHQRKLAKIFVTDLPHSSYEDALEYFLRAELAKPRFYCTNLLRIGICYMKLEKNEHARYYLTQAATYPAKTNEDFEAIKQAAKLLSKL